MAARHAIGGPRRRTWILAALLLAATWLGAAAPASAHSELESSYPAAGAIVDELPRAVRLTFGGPILLDGASVALVDGDVTTPLVGLSLDDDEKVLTAIVPATATADGPVAFRWSAVSKDGHTIGGDIGIGVGVGAVAAPTLIPPTLPEVGDPELVEGLVTADRLVGYLGLAVLCGGLVFLVTVWPAGADVRRTRLLLWGAWAAVLLSAVGGLLLQAATLRGSRLGKALDPDALTSVLDSPFGRAWGSRAILALLAIPVLTALGRVGREVVRKPWFVVSAAAVGLALLRTLGLVAHASEGDLGAIGGVADLIHLLGVVAWVGGLVVLAAVVLPRRQVEELRVVVPAYSRLALVSISAIVLAGTVMAWDLAGSFEDLRTTEWGRLLLLKIGLFVVVLVAAQLSKRWVLDRLGLAVALRGHLVLVRPFVLSVAAETLLAASVLGVASLLVTTSPG
jgi:putative copper export protein/methionine-rich copper-binding protein CopC